MKYLVLFVLSIVSCTSSFPGQKELNLIRNSAKKRMINELHLEPFGTGVSWPGKCQFIELDFNYRDYATISEARRLLVAAVKILIESAARVEGFEEYLAEPPFSEKNVAISIGFWRPKIESSVDPQIELVSTMWGKIDYAISWPDGINYDIVHEETYAEALEVLQNEEQEINKTFNN